MRCVLRFTQLRMKRFMKRVQFRWLPKIAVRHITFRPEPFLFLFFLSLHSSTLIHSRQEMSPLMVSRSGHGRQQARSKNIISARPRIITLQRPKNDRHPTSFNHGIMNVDFFPSVSPLALWRCCGGGGDDYLLAKMPAG